MGGVIAVVILALLLVPVFFVSVQRVLAGIGRRWRRRPMSRAHRLSQPKPDPVPAGWASSVTRRSRHIFR
jgi:multidrug efflux pump